jgi:hypothetical protein
MKRLLIAVGVFVEYAHILPPNSSLEDLIAPPDALVASALQGISIMQ